MTDDLGVPFLFTIIIITIIVYLCVLLCTLTFVNNKNYSDTNFEPKYTEHAIQWNNYFKVISLSFNYASLDSFVMRCSHAIE